MAPPPPPPTAAPPRRSRVQLIGGIVAAVVVIGIKIFAVAGVTHLIHGASAPIIVVAVVLVGVLARYASRFIGR
jgi:hypothetical protein